MLRTFDLSHFVGEVFDARRQELGERPAPAAACVHLPLRRIPKVSEVREQWGQVPGRVEHSQNSRRVGRRIINQ